MLTGSGTLPIQRRDKVVFSSADDYGKLVAFGFGKQGQIGTGKMEVISSPSPVISLNGKRIAMVSCGGIDTNETHQIITIIDSHTVAITSKGEVFEWGEGNKFAGPKPVPYFRDRRPITLSCGPTTSAVIANEGRVYGMCFDKNVQAHFGS
jgi:alpha-tubulin suppressor-like RCC1 family protein